MLVDYLSAHCEELIARRILERTTSCLCYFKQLDAQFLSSAAAKHSDISNIDGI